LIFFLSEVQCVVLEFKGETSFDFCLRPISEFFRLSRFFFLIRELQPVPLVDFLFFSPRESFSLRIEKEFGPPVALGGS